MGERMRTFEVLSRETGRYIYTMSYYGFEIEEVMSKKCVVFLDVETGEVLW